MSVLGDSASCSAGSNPLAQMNKYMSADRSLQTEHHAAQQGHAGGSIRQGDLRQLSQQDRQIYQQMQHGGRPEAFNFENFRNDVPRFDNGGAKVGNMPDRNWGAEFAAANQPQASMTPTHSNGSWANEFSKSQSPVFNQMPANSAPHSQMSMTPMPMSSMTGFRSGPYMSNFPSTQQMQTAGSSQQQQQEPTHQEAAKWEEEFKKMERHSSPPQQEATAETTSSATADKAEQEQEPSTFDLQDDDEVINGLEDKYSQYDDVFGNTYPPNWDEMWDNINDNANAEVRTRSEDFRGTSGTYEFAKENEYADEEDPFALGVYMMDNGAKLSCAVLCFEEAVKRDPSHVEAWARLGDAQAQNEVEEPAIAALERAVVLNPRHERALLNLAISYTNEGYDAAASQILEKWIIAKYPDIAELVPAEQNPSREQLHNRVQKMFLTAAQRTPVQGLDPDVQVGLGVLCYRNDDYTKAIDCFRSALSVRPNDASLWNRLGATLANASHPEEAIDAYYKALELRPSFVRARYNLAVSCINIGLYKEAAENILSAISLHDTEDGDVIDFNRSSNLIDTLRRVFFALDRRDLLAKLAPGAKLSDFRGTFNF